MFTDAQRRRTNSLLNLNAFVFPSFLFLLLEFFFSDSLVKLNWFELNWFWFELFLETTWFCFDCVPETQYMFCCGMGSSICDDLSFGLQRPDDEPLKQLSLKKAKCV